MHCLGTGAELQHECLGKCFDLWLLWSSASISVHVFPFMYLWCISVLLMSNMVMLPNLQSENKCWKMQKIGTEKKKRWLGPFQIIRLETGLLDDTALDIWAHNLKFLYFFIYFFFLAIYLLIHSCTKLNTKLCVILKFLCFLRVDIHCDPRIQIFVPRRKIALLWWAGTIRQLLAQPNYMLEVAHSFLYLLNQFCAYKTLTSLFPFLILHSFLSYVLKLWTNTNYWHR